LCGGDESYDETKFRICTVKGKKWYIYLNFPGGKRVVRVTPARTKTEAQHILNSHLEKNVDYLVRGEITLKKYYEKWLKRREVDLKPSTLESYESYFRNHILPFLGERKMNRIHSGDIYDLRSHLAAKKIKNGKSLSAKSINNYLLALSGLFSDALDDSVVETNPVKIKKHRLDYEHKEADYFQPKEMWDLLKHMSHDSYPFFFLLWNTGLRIGEAIGLKWSDFDLQSNVININRTIYESRNGKIEVKPKSKAGKRFVLITPQLRTVMEIYRENSYGDIQR
jgi:integrase